MVGDFDVVGWDDAIEKVKAVTETAFHEYSNSLFWREFDIQGLMYGEFFKNPSLRPYVHREHRIWGRDGVQELRYLDLALLDPEKRSEGYPYWPVRELIQLKYPVEFATGMTEPDDMSEEKASADESYYMERCRNRILDKVLEDYRKFEEIADVARNISPSARCHILYFDSARKLPYASSESLKADLKSKKGVEPDRVGPWPLILEYQYQTPKHRAKNLLE